MCTFTQQKNTNTHHLYLVCTNLLLFFLDFLNKLLKFQLVFLFVLSSINLIDVKTVNPYRTEINTTKLVGIQKIIQTIGCHGNEFIERMQIKFFLF